MADLATCYFCGTLEADIEEHPVIPAELDPPADRQQTVAVCPECARKFNRAIEPLLGFLSESDVPDATESATSTKEPEAGPGERSGTEVGSREHDGRDRQAEDAPDHDGDDGPTHDETETNAGSATGGDTETEAGPETSEEAGDEPIELPDAARDVLRLLQNREFPVDRAEIETVATSAYELGSREAREAIDALVEAGVLEEADGRLDRPED